MHEVMIISLQDKLKLFDAGGQIFLYGESKAVADEDKTWQRITGNINIAPQELSILFLYDKFKIASINRIAKFFPDVNTLRMTDINSAAKILSLLHGKDEFIFCGAAIRFDKAGEMHCEYTEDADIKGLRRLSFEEIFSQEETINSLKKKLKDSQRNATRAENKLKTLQKKLGR